MVDPSYWPVEESYEQELHFQRLANGKRASSIQPGNLTIHKAYSQPQCQNLRGVVSIRRKAIGKTVSHHRVLSPEGRHLRMYIPRQER